MYNVRNVFILFWLTFSNLAVICAQDYFMYVGGEKRYFEISPNKILVQFAENTETKDFKSIIEKNTSFPLTVIVG